MKMIRLNLQDFPGYKGCLLVIYTPYFHIARIFQMCKQKVVSIEVLHMITNNIFHTNKPPLQPFLRDECLFFVSIYCRTRA